MRYATRLALAIFIVLFGLWACSPEPAEPGADLPAASQTREAGSSGISGVRVIATRDFGQDLMFDEVLEVSPCTPAMAALQKAAEVETAYGGGFVNAINGVRSGFSGGGQAKADWFIYLNGLQMNTGALDYILQPGDVAHWDFHDWSFRPSLPATAGAFPEPFLHGYGGRVRPTLIAYPDNLQEPAQQLQERLVALGVNDAGLRSTAEISASERESSNLILLGTADDELITELNQNWARLGFFARFEDGKLVVLDAGGETAKTYGAATGLIQATQNPWNPNGTGACENVAWMVTGTDEGGVRAAVDALVKYQAQFKYAFAVVIANGEIIKIPQ